MSGQPEFPSPGPMGTPSPLGSAAKVWTPTLIDWSVKFPRSPQHLSNQLRGKRFNADKPQLELFDRTYESLPDDVRRDVDRHNIKVVGFNLSVPQQKCYEAALYLLTATGGKSQRIVFTPDDWIRAYGLQKRERNTRDTSEISSFERDEAFAALISLGVLPWLIQYRRMVDGRWKEVTRVAPLWTCGTQRDSAAQRSTPDSARPLTSQDLAPLVHTFKNAEYIELEFNPVWFDQHDSFYFYKPAHLHQRIGLAISGNVRRNNRYVHAFLDWVFSEVGRIRVQERQQEPEAGEDGNGTDWTFSEGLTELALQLRMASQVSKRNWSRIRKTITDCAVLARDAQIITLYEWREDQLAITFNQKTFTLLDQYHEALAVKRAASEQRRKVRKTSGKPEVDGVAWPYPRPVKDYTPGQLKEFKLGQLAELAKLRQKAKERACPPARWQLPPAAADRRGSEDHRVP
ncbi:MAG: hypothetical protein QM770_01160 [Tepidisphaeraceae bacterium]